MFLDISSNEVVKLQQHLALLRDEYSKLQSQKNEIERKYALLSANYGEISENSYVSRLLNVVNGLFDNSMFR